MSKGWRADYLAIVTKYTSKDPSAAGFEPETAFADLGVDSAAVVFLMIDLEDELAVRFPDELLTAETFYSPASLWRVVEKLVA